MTEELLRSIVRLLQKKTKLYNPPAGGGAESAEMILYELRVWESFLFL